MNERIKPVRLLLVEDNPGDVRLVKEALREQRILSELHNVSNGEDALFFLRRQGEYEDAPRPDLILLDLNLPRKDGREVLEEIKRDPQLSAIPVVVLTSSEADRDITRTYELHANCYITKPALLEDFMKVIHEIEGFWLALVKLPSNE